MIAAITDIKLKILVFGPNPSVPHSPGFDADLARKRLEIRDALNFDGHGAVFPEDLMVGSLDPTINNSFILEQLLVREYDMVVSLVASPGSISEMSLFHRDHLALKAAFFFNQDHCAGFAFQQAQMIQALGASLETYIYPVDLTTCNLMTRVRAKVWQVRVCKFMA